MIKLIFGFMLLLSPITSFGKQTQEGRAVYMFDFASFKGVVKEVRISFNNVESESDMTASTDATLKDGTAMSGQFACKWDLEKTSIHCRRDDNGGSFTFVNDQNGYKLRFQHFDLNEEGSIEEVAVNTRTPGETDEVLGKKE